MSRMSDSLEITDSKAVVGTFAYMAPEQGRSSRGATEQSDSYTLGVILYECATGRRPFDAKAPYVLLHAILNEPLVPPGVRRPGLPPAFDAMVLRAMSRDPARRFSCADELGEALLAFATPRIADRWRGEFQAPRSKSSLESVPPLISSRNPPVTRARRILRVWHVAALLLCGFVAAFVALKIPGATRASSSGASSPLPATASPAALPDVPPLPAPPTPPVEHGWPPPPTPTPVRTASPPSSTRPRASAAPARPAAPPAAPVLDNGAPILEP